MNSSATDRTFPLSQFLNRRNAMLIAGAVVLVIFATNANAYFTLSPLIPPERLVQARHRVFFANWPLAVLTGLVLLVIAWAAMILERYVLRPTSRLTKWADERCREGEGPSLRTFTRVVEIARLTASFRELFNLLALRVIQIRHLVGGMRHNLRAHLSHISNAAQFAKAGKCSALEAAEVALNEVKAITHILDVNAEIAKNFSHILGDPPTEIRVADVVQKCLDGLELLAEEKGVELDTEYPPDDLVVVAHLGKIDDIIHNLVNNAIKYTPTGGKVKLAVRPRPDAKADVSSQQIEIEVTDTGVGIPDAEKPHVFEYQFRGSSAQSTSGDGYGLNHVASIMSLYDGTSEIRDNAPQGTTITIRLNMPPSHPSTACTIPREQEVDASGRSPEMTSIAPCPNPLSLTWLYPNSNSAWIYTALVTIPMSGLLAALLFYECFCDTPMLADTTLVCSIYVVIYSVLVIGWKIILLRSLRRKSFAKTRLRIVLYSALANAAVILAFFVGQAFITYH